MYDITNKWSFDGIDRWIKEVNEVRRRSARKSYANYATGDPAVYCD